MDGQTVTLSGCLKAEGTAPGTTPNPAERVGVAPDYVLSNPQVKSASPASAAGAPGAPAAGAAAAAAAPSPMNVKLTSVDNDQMRQNVNRQIEVTGQLSMGAAKSGEARAGAAITGAAPMPELKVQSLRVLGESCTPK